MGGSFSCVRTKGSGQGSLSVPRDSPFGKLKRSLSSRSSARARALVAPSDRSLVDLGLGAVCEHIHDYAPTALAALPPDLAQLLLDRLIETGVLDEETATRLAGLSHYQLRLGGYPGPVTDGWLVSLTNSELETIILDHSLVTDVGLLRLGHLPALRMLSLQHCQHLSSGFACVLARFPALEELRLSGIPALHDDSEQWVRACPSLRSLNMSLCRTVRTLEPLRALTSLESVDLGWCSGIEDAALGALRGLVALRRLILSRTGVTDAGVAALGPFPNLMELRLEGTGVRASGLASLLPRLPALRTLDLARCPGVGDGAARAICGAAGKLESLDISYTRIGDSGLTSLAHALRTLRSLNLEACPVGDAGVRELRGLTVLEWLDLSDTAVGDAGVIEGVSRLTNLHTLSLAFTAVEDEGIEALGALRALRRLNLDCRGVGDSSCAALAQLTELEDLDLFGARITDAGCAALAPLRALTSLEICGGGVGDGGVAALSRLASLQRLSLAQNTRITSRALPSLLHLKQLVVLNLSQTSVSNGIGALGQLPRLERLILHGTRVRASGARRVQENLPGLVVVGVQGIDVPK